MGKLGTLYIPTGSGVQEVEVWDALFAGTDAFRVAVDGNSVGAIPLTTTADGDTGLRIYDGDSVKEAFIPTETSSTYNWSDVNSGANDLGSPYAFTVESTIVSEVAVELIGAGGGTGTENDGTAGGKVTANIRLEPSDTLYLYPSRHGDRGSTSDNVLESGDGGDGGHKGNHGQYEDGPDGFTVGGGGGGATEIRLNGTDDSNTLICAAGGNGQASDDLDAGRQDGGAGATHGSEGAGSGVVVNGDRVYDVTITDYGGAPLGENGSISLSYKA